MELGVLGQTPTGRITRFKAAMAAQGKTAVWQRMFFTSQSASGLGAVATEAAAGWKVYFSFKASGGAGEAGWNAVTAGAEDARWVGIGNFLAGIPNAGMWCFNHEPENDGATPYGSNVKGDSFRAAFDHIARIIKPLAPAWKASACLFDEVFPNWPFARGGNWSNDENPNRWYPSESEVFGLDYYNYRGASDGGSHWATQDIQYPYSIVDDALAFMNGWGVNDLVFPEFAMALRNPAVSPGDEAAQREPWIRGFSGRFAPNPRIKAAMYFEINELDNAGKANYSITDPSHPATYLPTVQAFASLDGLVVPPPPPPPGPFVAGSVSPQTMVMMGA